MGPLAMYFSHTTEERVKDKYQQIMDDIDEIREQQRDISEMGLSEDITKAAVGELETKIESLKLELVVWAV